MSTRTGPFLSFMQQKCKAALHKSCSHRKNSIVHHRCLSNSAKRSNDISRSGARVLFLGNDNFSLESLKAVTEIIYSKECLTVVTTTADNVVGKFAKKNDLPRITWKEYKVVKKDCKFDVGVVASFGHLIPRRVIDQCDLGILNVHGSVLPKYRGAAPISWAIINGDKETGVTIMQISPHKFDVGPILAAQYVKIDPHVRAPELTRVMAHVGAELLQNVLKNIEEAISCAKPQEPGIVSLAPKLTPEMGLINWETNTAAQVYNIFRGLYGFLKLYTFYKGRRIDLNEFSLVEVQDSETERYHMKPVDNVIHCTDRRNNFNASNLNYNPKTPVKYLSQKELKSREEFQSGQLFFHNNSLFIKCAQSSWISVALFKVNTKWQSAGDFQNGYLSKAKPPHIFSREKTNQDSAIHTDVVIQSA